MNPAFTPGDWWLNGNTIEAFDDPVAGTKLDVAEIACDGNPRFAEQTKADAQLLVSAKKLYLAAKAALEWHEAALRGATSSVNAFDVLDTLKAAVAAAEER